MLFINDRISHYFQVHYFVGALFCTFNKGIAYPQKTQFDVPNIFYLHKIDDISACPCCLAVISNGLNRKQITLCSNFQVFRSYLHPAIILGPLATE